MTARESGATERAVAEARRSPHVTLTSVAAAHGIALSTLKRALRRAGVAARPALSGTQAKGYIDGRTLP